MKATLGVCLATVLIGLAQAQTPAASKGDSLGRDNPRSTVTRFLEACRTGDYDQASQYLDLDRVRSRDKAQAGASLAKQLEAILNSAAKLDVDSLSQDPNTRSPYDITSVKKYGQTASLTVSQKMMPGGASPIWLFSADTVAQIPQLTPDANNPVIARYLPKFFLTVELWETPLWKWIALVLGAAVLLSLSRVLDVLFSLGTRTVARYRPGGWSSWAHEIIKPIRVMVCLAIFRLYLEVIAPSALARIYIGRLLQLIFAVTIAWCLIKLVDVFFRHLEVIVDVKHRVVSRSLLRMGRRTSNALVIVLSLLVLLGNWGYNTTTLIAGLGVGGIAVALAAQQTIANVFGGVSIIGDNPVSIGEFGKFGDLIGTVEDIGMRSTRVRTLNRTLVSVPNSSFASFNLENYSLRDKILFNPTFQIQRSTPEDKIRALLDALTKALGANKRVELGPTPVRLTGLAAASFSLEFFCYVLTEDIDEFYKVQGELLLTISNTLKSTGVELA